jgi:hypothetical protein
MVESAGFIRQWSRETCATASLYFVVTLLCFDRQGYCARWRRLTPFARTKSGGEPNGPRRRRPKVERIRKKDGAHPFARLSLASTRCLIEGAAGRFAGCRKKDRGRWKGRSRTRGADSVSRLPEGQPLSPSPNWRLRRSARLGRFFEMPSFVNRNAPAISHPPLLPEAPLRRQGQRTSGQSEVDAFSGTTFR